MKHISSWRRKAKPKCSQLAFPDADLSVGEEATSLVWIAVKNSLTTTGPATWYISGASMTQKHWQEFVGDLRDSFRLSEVSLQEAKVFRA